MILAVFLLVYAAMILGGIPGLALDRTGAALLGALALIAAGAVSLEGAWRSLDLPTMALLFGLMVVSAQLRLGGFYAATARRIATAALRPYLLLGVLMAAAGVLSAVLANDIVCLAMTPVLVDACVERRLDPKPYLLGLACAANVGSAATLIGNPQNMLIGQTLGLSFSGFLLVAAVPAALGLAVTWALFGLLYRGRWTVGESAGRAIRRGPGRSMRRNAIQTVPAPSGSFDPVVPPFQAWQSAKGLAVLAAVLVLFLAGSWPREIVALAAAGVLLLSRRMASRSILGLVDWHLLVLFAGLFVVQHALESSGMLAAVLESLRDGGFDVRQPPALFVTAVLLSNLVSNVPATMLLLPAATHPIAGAVLALASTLAGNLLLVGSIANLIVVEQAALLGVRISWRDHARVGIPVTLATLTIAAAWLWLSAGAR